MQENRSIGIRIHDAHHGLVQSTGAIVESELGFLKELGAAVQIATVIKDHETIHDVKPFFAATGEIKIQQSLAKAGLEHLQALDFVRLQYKTGKSQIKRIDILVPGLDKLYEDAGDYFKSENESELAKNTVEIIDKLSHFPQKEREIISSLELSPKDYDIIKDIGKSTSLLSTYTSPADSESIIYSPLYWDDNPASIFELQKKYSSDEMFTVLSEIKGYQGISGDHLENGILRSAIELGCFPTLSVNSTSGSKKFVFTPQLGVGKEEKSLLHKARVLLSCVRYGENFAGITKIFAPDRLLNALVGRGYLKAHSETLKQYESARNCGLVQIIPSGKKYEVHFVDNDENRKAFAIALEMLTIGEAPKHDESLDAAKKILLPDPLNHPLQTRTHILSNEPFERSENTVNKINDLIRGVDI